MDVNAIVTFISGIVAFANGLFQVSVGSRKRETTTMLVGLTFVILGAGFAGYGAYVLSVS